MQRMNLILVVVTWSCFRKDDWPDKRIAMDDRYSRSDFTRQDRYQDIDHRDRGRYQEDIMVDRRDNTRGIGADRDGQVNKNLCLNLCFYDSCYPITTVLNLKSHYSLYVFLVLQLKHQCVLLFGGNLIAWF